MATCPDNFAHMADDLEQNMILNGENDLGKYLQKILSIFICVLCLAALSWGFSLIRKCLLIPLYTFLCPWSSDLFGFCSMIVDDNENGEELERRMGESESDSPMSLGASFTSSENSPSLKANSLDEDISPFFPPGGFSELNKCLSKPEVRSP